MSYEACDLQTDSRYPFDPRANAFELAKMESIRRKQHPLILITSVKSSGVHYFIGPSKSYSHDYPVELEPYITKDDFEAFISEVNDVIVKYWPCFSLSFWHSLFRLSLVSQVCIYPGFVLKMCKDFWDMYQRDGTRLGNKRVLKWNTKETFQIVNYNFINYENVLFQQVIGESIHEDNLEVLDVYFQTLF